MPSHAQILCKGSWKDRATALFSLLDTERQGSLSREDMHMYFSSTFKVRQNSVMVRHSLYILNTAQFERGGIHAEQRVLIVNINILTSCPFVAWC